MTLLWKLEKAGSMQIEQLQKDMITAMKARDKVRKEAISSMISAVKKVAIDEGSRDNIKEDLVNRVILKEMKIAKEQVDTCPDERAELKAEYQATYDIIKEYAPDLMSYEEVKSYIADKFQDAAAAKNKGQLMSYLAAADAAALTLQFFLSCCQEDCSANTTAHLQSRISRINNSICVHFCNIIMNDLKWHNITSSLKYYF